MIDRELVGVRIAFEDIPTVPEELVKPVIIALESAPLSSSVARQVSGMARLGMSYLDLGQPEEGRRLLTRARERVRSPKNSLTPTVINGVLRDHAEHWLSRGYAYPAWRALSQVSGSGDTLTGRALTNYLAAEVAERAHPTKNVRVELARRALADNLWGEVTRDCGHVPRSRWLANQSRLEDLRSSASTR